MNKKVNEGEFIRPFSLSETDVIVLYSKDEQSTFVVRRTH